MENAGATCVPTKLTVVRNWFEELERLVPTDRQGRDLVTKPAPVELLLPEVGVRITMRV